MRLRQSDQALQLSRRGTNGLAALAIQIPHFHITGGNGFGGLLSESWGSPSGKLYVRPQECRVLNVTKCTRYNEFSGLVDRPGGVKGNDVAPELGITVLVDLVEQQEDDVKSGKDRGLQVEIVDERLFHVVLGIDGISRCQNACSRIQRGDDPRFGNGYRLLLHDLVQDGPRGITHLVKLVNAADAAITQHECPTREI